MTVKSYMTEHPDENCLSASAKINVHRKRIAKLMTILDNLPKEFIEKHKDCNDPSILHRMSVKPLYQIAQIENKEQMKIAIESLLASNDTS